MCLLKGLKKASHSIGPQRSVNLDMKFGKSAEHEIATVYISYQRLILL